MTRLKVTVFKLKKKKPSRGSTPLVLEKDKEFLGNGLLPMHYTNAKEINKKLLDIVMTPKPTKGK